MGPPVTVCVTGAAGQIAYSLVFMVAKGDMLGPNTPIFLKLLDIPPMLDALKGVVMELEDCALPLLAGVSATTDLKDAFSDVDIALLVGAMPRRDGMERKDLLKANCSIFRAQGKALNDYAKKTVKVLVVGNPANTNCLIAQTSAPSIPPENFSALTRLDHARARAQIAAKAKVAVTNVHNLCIWGNHSSTQYPDVRFGYIDSPDGSKTSIEDAVNDTEWLQTTFISNVQLRGAEVIKARKLSSAASAATAIVEHIKDWVLGTKEGEIVSMAVLSDGSYDVPMGLIYSFPVTCSGGKYAIVQGLTINEFSRKKMDLTSAELEEEKSSAFQFMGA
mmetsp:Transcript_45599/g.74320  ORF Transcript_45599/g.74320 Transcript_45599/m.74320 type:complete len:334 (-) Transcript_45599:465-1466(-)